MAGNALGRLYIKVAEDAAYMPLNVQPQQGSTPQAQNQYPMQTGSGYNTWGGIAAQGAGALFGQDVGQAAGAALNIGSMIGVLPQFLQSLQQVGPGQNPEDFQRMRTQMGVTSMVAIESMGSELRKSVAGENNGALGQLFNMLGQAAEKYMPGDSGKKIVDQVKSFATVDPKDPMAAQKMAQVDKVLGIVANTIAQINPEAAQFVKGLLPGAISDAQPLLKAYKITHGGNFDQNEFEKFVAGFKSQVDRGTFTRTGADGKPVPGSMPAQDAANAAAFAAQHMPQGTTPDQLLKATQNVTQNIHGIMDAAGKHGIDLNVDSAYAIAMASPEVGQLVANPKAAGTFAEQIMATSQATGQHPAKLIPQLDLARRQGMNPAVALQGIAQHALATNQLNQSPAFANLPTAEKDRLAAGYGQAATTGIHSSDNLKVLAAAAGISPAFNAKLQQAFKSGDPQAIAGLVQQAKAMPNALARYKTTDTSYVENMLAQGGPNATKAFLGAEITDLSRRAMTDQLTKMPTSEILRRLKTHDLSGLSNQAAAMFDRPEFISSVLSTRGQYDVPKVAPQAPQQAPPKTPWEAYTRGIPWQTPAVEKPATPQVAQTPPAAKPALPAVAQSPTPTAPKPAVGALPPNAPRPLPGV